MYPFFRAASLAILIAGLAQLPARNADVFSGMGRRPGFSLRVALAFSEPHSCQAGEYAGADT